MRERRHSTDLLFIILLFSLFTVCALLLMLFGARIYENSARRMQSNYTVRTALAYVSEKLHQNDRSGAVTLSQVEELPALAITDSSGEECFVTYIYYSDGFLRELFVQRDTPVTAALGSPITELSSFTVETEGAGFRLTAADEDGETLSLFLCPRSGEVGS